MKTRLTMEQIEVFAREANTIATRTATIHPEVKAAIASRVLQYLLQNPEDE